MLGIQPGLLKAPQPHTPISARGSCSLHQVRLRNRYSREAPAWISASSTNLTGKGNSDAHQTNRKPQSPTHTEVNKELLSIALPVLATLAADPLAGLVGTAFVGRLGALELAGVGVALSIFNSVTKLFNVPLLSITTSAVAAAKGHEQQLQQKQNGDEQHSSPTGRESLAAQQVPAVSNTAGDAIASAASAAILLAAGVGCLQALLLGIGGTAAAGLWGLPAGSGLRTAALQFLQVRALGAPVTLMMLVLQGVFRGLQDTRTPLNATLAANAINIALAPLLIFQLGLGARGAALATVAAEAVPCFLLLRELGRRYRLDLSHPTTLLGALQQFKPTGFLMLRTLAVTGTYAVATSLAARTGAASAAAHQICFQLWLASSLLADSLAVAAQTMLASSVSAGELDYARKVVNQALVMSGALGLILAASLAVTHDLVPPLFTHDAEVLAAVAGVLPVVVLTQPINAFAFVWDGILFGAGGFWYASVAMAFCAAPAVAIMAAGNSLAPPGDRLSSVWHGLALLMLLRAVSIAVPYGLQTGPFASMFADEKRDKKSQ